MTVLIVVAHPDDEVLGAGGFATTLSQHGVGVRACLLSATATARRYRPHEERLREHALRASELLGLETPLFGEFPNIRFNTVPHLDLVQFIEQAIETTGATSIVTHHPADLNDDHGHTSKACQAAARLFQRKPGVPPLQGLYFMEILSSTEWAFPNGRSAFSPTTFVPLSETDIEAKAAALEAYEGVTRPPPHPRNRETVVALARYRGSQAGVRYAEAFETAFRCTPGPALVSGKV